MTLQERAKKARNEWVKLHGTTQTTEAGANKVYAEWVMKHQHTLSELTRLASDGWNFDMETAPRPPMEVDGGIIIWDGDQQAIVRWDGYGWRIGMHSEGYPIRLVKRPIAWRHMHPEPQGESQ